MEILLCIDDTDNIDSIGTGKLASLLSDALENNGWGEFGPITRHQLLVHQDIPYTSHNSSMCCTGKIKPEFFEMVIEFAQSFLRRESAPGSDPGLCIVNRGLLSDPDALITFGKKAKTTVITKEEAYQLAERLAIHLSEHGGTGQGIIGALAGCGLRLTGNDGRFRGHFQIDRRRERIKVCELMQQTGVDVVKSLDGRVLDNEEVVQIGEKVKAVLQDSKSTLLVFAEQEIRTGERYWRTCTKQQLKIF